MLSGVNPFEISDIQEEETKALHARESLRQIVVLSAHTLVHGPAGPLQAGT
jgi:hypothetical protein